MCLIIFTPKFNKSKIDKAVLKRGFEKNDDGAGFAFVKDGRVQISKAYFNFKRFYKAYRKAANKINGPLLIHFRWGTCGGNTEVNTQPLELKRNQLVMAHNGVFEGLSFANSKISDSVRLAKILKDFGWELPLKPSQIAILQGLCANYSKLVFLNNKKEFKIINESLGKWVKGCWYSDNGSCLEKEPDYNFDMSDEQAINIMNAGWEYAEPKNKKSKNRNSKIIQTKVLGWHYSKPQHYG